MFIRVNCAECGRTYQRTVLNTNGCPNCGDKEEGVSCSNNYNSGDYATLNETEEEKLSYKKYIERENYLHFGNPTIFMKVIILLTGLVKRIKEKLDT